MTYFLVQKVEDPEGSDISPLGFYPDMDSLRSVADSITKQMTHIDGIDNVRFAVFESGGDVDGDGFPDSFKFHEVLQGTPPQPETSTVRKVKRKTKGKAK